MPKLGEVCAVLSFECGTLPAFMVVHRGDGAAAAVPVEALQRSGLVQRALDDARVVVLDPLPQAEAMDALGVRSAMLVPLAARSRCIGLLVLGRADGEQRYRADELQLAEDVGRRAALVLDNARLYAETAESDRRKDEFLAMLAHELRNPLNAISTAMHLVDRSAAADESTSRPRAIVERQVKHLARMVDDLLDVSRITRGRMELRAEPLDLREVVQHAVHALRPVMDRRGHDLVVRTSHAPVPVEADPARFEQVVVNLLDNAAKYTDPGGCVRVSLDREGDEAVLRVEDNGIGMAPEMLPQIFDLFSQVDRSLDRTRGGIGVGLTLVKGLVELHGGRITAASDGLGKGSRFEVRLPARALGRPAPPVPEPADGRHRPWRVLLVEDNADSRETLKDLLEMWGHSVHTAPDGSEGLQRLQELRPDVALVDIGLPGRD
ncbi:MAG: ATP-binding protein, partial [Myxococcales bacterium]